MKKQILYTLFLFVFVTQKSFAQGKTTVEECDFSQIKSNQLIQKSLVAVTENSMRDLVESIADSLGYDIDEGTASSKVEAQCLRYQHSQSPDPYLTTLSVVVTTTLPDADTKESFNIKVKYEWTGETIEMGQSGFTFKFMTIHPETTFVHSSLSSKDLLPLTKTTGFVSEQSIQLP